MENSVIDDVRRRQLLDAIKIAERNIATFEHELVLLAGMSDACKAHMDRWINYWNFARLELGDK